jgi:hypothetical protein
MSLPAKTLKYCHPNPPGNIFDAITSVVTIKRLKILSDAFFRIGTEFVVASVASVGVENY